MEVQYYIDYSPNIGRDMEVKSYGHGGKPVLFIPCQDGRFFDFENFKMTDVWRPWIDSGQVMVFSIDTIDKETYSSPANPYDRIRRHEDWVRYITDEMVPFMHYITDQRNGGRISEGVLAFGCSLGATHAANLYFRRPDLFDSVLAISGIYSTSYGFGDYKDEFTYLNSLVECMPNFPEDHPYMELFRRHRAVICCGQGAWEQPETTIQLKNILESKGIPAWVDLWGYDVNHDWPWWYKMVPYFLPYLLGQ